MNHEKYKGWANQETYEMNQLLCRNHELRDEVGVMNVRGKSKQDIEEKLMEYVDERLREMTGVGEGIKGPKDIIWWDFTSLWLVDWKEIAEAWKG